MPVMNGFDFLKLFENTNARKSGYDPKVYILTSSESKADAKKSEEFFVEGYIDKPLTKNKLCTILVA